MARRTLRVRRCCSRGGALDDEGAGEAISGVGSQSDTESWPMFRVWWYPVCVVAVSQSNIIFVRFLLLTYTRLERLDQPCPTCTQLGSISGRCLHPYLYTSAPLLPSSLTLPHSFNSVPQLAQPPPPPLPADRPSPSKVHSQPSVSELPRKTSTLFRQNEQRPNGKPTVGRTSRSRSRLVWPGRGKGKWQRG